mgnify:CR=1 FL=1
MKGVYPIIISSPKGNDKYYDVYIPDFDINTEGKNVSDALFMAKDAIGITGISMQDRGIKIPKAKTLKIEAKADELVALIDIDFNAYREKENTKTVRKNCTIPYWMNKEAEERNINFSAVLQESLRTILKA